MDPVYELIYNINNLKNHRMWLASHLSFLDMICGRDIRMAMPIKRNDPGMNCIEYQLILRTINLQTIIKRLQ